MSKILIVVCFVLLTFNYVFCQESVFVSKEFNFKITPPTIENKSVNTHVAMFFLPQEKGFSPNIIIIVQEFKESIAEYDKMSKEEFAKMKWVILKSEIKGEQVIYEYTGLSNKLKIRCYVRACKVGDSIYLVTATALEEQWEKTAETLIKSVESFQFTK